MNLCGPMELRNSNFVLICQQLFLCQLNSCVKSIQGVNN